jgi:DNA-binding MarR family transcriptional regulator
VASLLGDVHLAYHVLQRIVARELDEAAVSMSEALVLRVVDLNARVTVTELREATGLKSSTLTSMLTRLEDRQYVYREELPGDMRFTLVRPTHVGARIADFVDQLLDSVEDGLAAQFPDARHGCITILASGVADYARYGLRRPMD